MVNNNVEQTDNTDTKVMMHKISSHPQNKNGMNNIRTTETVT